MAVAFDLTSDWHVAATIEEVSDVLSDAERLPDWWGDVYLSVAVIDPGDAQGLGRRVAVHSRGKLPYTLRWQAQLVEDHRPRSWVIEATGDLAGRGQWVLTQKGDKAHVHYDWHVVVEKPLLKLFAPLLKPVFAANHRWAMAKGCTGLAAEISRRRRSD